MICIRCDATDFETRDEVIKQELGTDTISVLTPASVCCMCGWVTVTAEQADELIKRTVAAYAKRKADRKSKPPPKIGQRYKSISTGGRATLTEIYGDGVQMEHETAHGTRRTKQSWKTFFVHWKPI